MVSCPTCNKDVDPLRAPSARVIGGRVVAFCSAACAAAGTEAGAAAARARVAPAAEPAPEPVPGAAPKPEAAPEAAPEPRPEPKLGPAPEAANRVADAPSIAAAAIEVLKQTGRIGQVDELDRPRSMRSTNPIEPEDVVDEREAPRRARTEPPPPPFGRAESRAESEGLDQAAPPRPRRRGLVLMFAGAIIIGGMAIAIVQALSPSSPAPVKAAPDSSHVEDARVSTPLWAAVDHTAAARSALTELLHADTDRVRRVAAVALARTGDVEAVKTLAELLAAEASDITRLDIAYALARAGDDRGMIALKAALKSARRDVRADAARMLVLLGDPGGSGAKVLATFIELRTHRLGAAEALARIADPKALAALDAIHADQTATADDRIRAAIALGRAKRPDVAEELRGLLTDGRFNAFAAASLAELGDAAGRAVLVKQLDVPSLRVGAAVALRRLEPALDPEPLIPTLTAALAADKDVARVTAAEAMLVLTGPQAWAERD